MSAFTSKDLAASKFDQTKAYREQEENFVSTLVSRITNVSDKENSLTMAERLSYSISYTTTDQLQISEARLLVFWKQLMSMAGRRNT